MQQEFCRTEILIGSDGISLLAKAKVAVFGLGGVGAYVAEGLARCGIGSLTLVDHQNIKKEDINRQLLALHSTLGKSKVEVCKERIRDIESGILVHTYQTFYCQESGQLFDLTSYDYIIDAMDTMSSKLLLIENAKKAGVAVISAMGLDNKLNPAKIQIDDIAKVSVCPLAREMKRELKKRRIRNVRVLYSKELPLRLKTTEKTMTGSISFVPSVAGMMIAGEVIRGLLKRK